MILTLEAEVEFARASHSLVEFSPFRDVFYFCSKLQRHVVVVLVFRIYV